MKKRLKALEAKVAEARFILAGSQLAPRQKAKSEKAAHRPSFDGLGRRERMPGLPRRPAPTCLRDGGGNARAARKVVENHLWAAFRKALAPEDHGGTGGIQLLGLPIGTAPVLEALR